MDENTHAWPVSELLGSLTKRFPAATLPDICRFLGDSEDLTQYIATTNDLTHAEVRDLMVDLPVVAGLDATASQKAA